jgi:serine/threonine protein kinase
MIKHLKIFLCFLWGILLDGTNVAMKLLNKSHQQVNEFLNEIVLMTSVRHKNLMKVKGFSLHSTQRLIVFEFVENKNLVEALWGMSFST